MRIGIGVGIPYQVQIGALVEQIINQTTAATLAPFSSGDTLGDILTAGTYTSSAGTPIVTYTSDGVAIELTDPAVDLAFIRAVVTDDQGTPARTFTVGTIRYAAPVAGSLTAVDAVVGSVPTVNVAAGFTGENLTYTEDETWASISGSTLTLTDEIRTDTLTITATNSGGSATVDLSVTIDAAPVAVNPSLALSAQVAGGTGSPDSVPVTYSYAGADDVDLYAATGATSFAITEAQLIAGAGGAAVEFDNQVGYTGGVIDLNSFTDDAVAEVAFVAVERNNGGTSGIQRIALTDIDFTALQFTGAVVEAVADNILAITLDDEIYGSTSAGDWSLTGNTIIATSFVSGSSLIELTLGTSVVNADDYTGDLTYSGTTLTDERGNVMLGFSGEDVTNNVPATGAVTDTFTVGSDTNITSYTGESGLAYTLSTPNEMIIDAATGRVRSIVGGAGSRYAQRGAATYTSTWNASGTMVHGSSTTSGTNCTCIAICTIDSSNYYFARHDLNADTINVVRIGGAGGTAVLAGLTIASVSTTYSFASAGDTIKVGLSYDGATMQLLLNDAVVASIAESDHQTGGVGIYCRDGAASGVRHELTNFTGSGT